jgi:uncharacterized protein YbjT (DUF2867 family)
MTPILVTGGTGTLGRVVVGQLSAAGHEVRVLTRRPADRAGWHTGDLTTGAGLAEAVAGAAVIVHCASDPRHWQHDIDGTRRLIEVARADGAPHLVYVSIVGVDRIPYGYYRAKLATERVVEESGLPWTIQRATQFHDLIRTIAAALAKSPVLPAPAGVSFQPVDVHEVATRIVSLATAPPVGRAPDFGGPEVRTAPDLLHAYLRATGRRRLVARIPLPGKMIRALRDGANLTPGHRDGQRTFEEFLADCSPTSPVG